MLPFLLLLLSLGSCNAFCPGAWAGRPEVGLSMSRGREAEYDRREALRRVASSVLGVAVANWAQAASAAVPQYTEDYDPSAGRVKSGAARNASGPVTADEASTNIDQASLISAVAVMETKAAAFPALVEEEMWDDILALAGGKTGKQASPFSILNSSTMGATTLGALAKKLNTSKTEAEQVLEIKEAASITLQQLRDEALANRVVYFNAVDKVKVEEIKGEYDQDAEETKEESRKLVKEFRAQLSLLRKALASIEPPEVVLK
ncbi:unnamed protein product [Chrysoparadoxa australica]